MRSESGATAFALAWERRALDKDGMSRGARDWMQTMEQAVRSDALWAPGQHLLLAVSGGADSMALLHVVRLRAAAWRVRVTVAHLDHRLRGAASAADARFVRAAARAAGWRCVCGRAFVAEQAAAAGVSLEMAARQARYDFLARTARRVRADVVVTAHTAEDQVESVFLRLGRGGGPGALGGIPERSRWRGLPVVRPLLQVRRAHLRAWLAAAGHAWREDASNADPRIPRNRVRREVLPPWEALFPGGVDAVARGARLARDEDAWIEEQAQAVAERCRGARDALLLAPWRGLPVPLQRRVLRVWLRARTGDDLSFVACEALRAGLRRGDGSVRLPCAGGVVERRYDEALFLSAAASLETPAWRVELPVPGAVSVPEAALRLQALRRPDGAGKPLDPARGVRLRADRLRDRPLTVRCREPGDRYRPVGRSGSRSLQDLFVDARLARYERGRVPILCCGATIVWVRGFPAASGWQAVADAPAVEVRVRSVATAR